MPRGGMALGSSRDDYTLLGKLPDPFIVTLRIDRQGVATARVKAQREAPEDLATLASWALLGNAPRPGGLGLPCSGIAMEMRGEDGSWNMEWTYEGASDPESLVFGDPATTTWEIDCVVSTEKIETHPDFLTIAAQYGVTSKNYDKSGQFLGFPRYLNDDLAAALGGVPGSTNLVQGLKNPGFGVEDYYVPRLSWRCSSAARQLPPDFRRNLGKIDKPRTQGGPPLPATEGRQNWIKTEARAVWKGNCYSTQESWELSGLNGWDPLIYKPN